jgi:hypothetical protein
MTRSERRRRRQNDRGYADPDVLRDGETQRVPHYLADASMTFVPAAVLRSPRIHYGRGYVTPAPLPVRDAAATAYYAMKDSLAEEWRRYGPPCCSGCADHKDQAGTVGHINQQLPWSTGQGPGNDCTINGAPGHYERHEGGQLVCVPDRRDAAPSNIGPPSTRVGFAWAQGGDCTCENGEPGLYVKQGDMLICQPRDFNGDAQARRDRAYFDSISNIENEWRNW